MSRSVDQTRTLGSTRKVYLREASPEGHGSKAATEVSQSRQRRGGGHLMAAAVCSRGHLALDE